MTGDKSCESGASIRISSRMARETSGVSRRQFIIALGAAATGALWQSKPAIGGRPSNAKIGFLISEQGAYAQEARSLLAGFECYVKEAGATNLTIVRRDPGPKDEKVLEALSWMLTTQNVDFLVSPPSLEGSENTLRGLSRASVILFVTNPCVRFISGELCDSMVFRLRPNTYQSAQPLSPWALRTLGKRVFITGSDDTMGNETSDFFAHGFDRAGGTFADREMVPPGSGNFSTVLEHIEKTKSDFVFASFSQRDALGFLRAVDARDPKLKTLVIGPEGLVSYPHTAVSLGKTLQGVRTLTCLRDPGVFVLRIKKKLGFDVAFAERAAEGYDIAKTIDLSTRHVTWDDQDRVPLAKYIENLELDGSRGRLTFDKNHDAIVDMVIQEWHFTGRAVESKAVHEIPEVKSLDFGCGKIGFPRRPDAESRDGESLWEEIEE